MKVLFLGTDDSPLITWLFSVGEEVICASEKIDPAFMQRHSCDFIISYGYRHIIKKEVLDLVSPKNAINLHISFLPWNRGADPNFWSFVDATPKGVTIHYLDEGVDTGDIIVQKEMHFSEDETLATTYSKLHEEILNLFMANWQQIKTGLCDRKKQQGLGSFHRSNMKKSLEHLLISSWDTPVSALIKYASEHNQNNDNVDQKMSG